MPGRDDLSPRCLTIGKVPAYVTEDILVTRVTKFAPETKVKKTSTIPGAEVDENLRRWIFLLSTSRDVQAVLNQVQHDELEVEENVCTVEYERSIPCEIPETWVNEQDEDAETHDDLGPLEPLPRKPHPSDYSSHQLTSGPTSGFYENVPAEEQNTRGAPVNYGQMPGHLQMPYGQLSGQLPVQGEGHARMPFPPFMPPYGQMPPGTIEGQNSGEGPLPAQGQRNVPMPGPGYMQGYGQDGQYMYPYHFMQQSEGGVHGTNQGPQGQFPQGCYPPQFYGFPQGYPGQFYQQKMSGDPYQNANHPSAPHDFPQGNMSPRDESQGHRSPPPTHEFQGQGDESGKLSKSATPQNQGLSPAESLSRAHPHDRHTAVQTVLQKQPIRIRNTEINVEIYNPKPVPLCTIEVRGPPNTIKEHMLELYFENTKKSGGADIERIEVNDDEEVAYVTFQTEEVAQRVAEKPYHKIGRKEIFVTLHMPQKKPNRQTSLSESKGEESDYRREQQTEEELDVSPEEQIEFEDEEECKCDNKNLGSEEDFNLNCQPCYRDGDDIRAHGYCIECEEHLCVTCYKFHRRTVLTRDHSLLDNLSMPRKAVKTVKNPINSSGQTDACTVECSVHQNKYIEYYCTLHKYLGCSVCVTLNHKHCDSVRFIPGIVDKNEVYASFVQTIDSLSLEFKDIKNVSEKNASEAKTIYSKAKQDKDGFRKVINSKLDLIDGDIDNEMKSVLKEDTKAMDDIKEMSDKRINQLESVLSDTDDKHKVGQACNAFIAIKRVEDNIVSFTDDLQSLQQRNTIRKYKFKPDDQLLELMSGHPIGMLLQSSKCKQECAMGPTNTPANTSDAKHHTPKAAEPDRLKDGKPVVRLLPLTALKTKELELQRVGLDANVGLAKTVIQEKLKDPLPKDYQKSGTDQSMSVGIDSCVICMDKIIEPKQLSCGHVFCTECITAHFGYKKTCPTCGAVCGVITGDQPDGRMRVNDFWMHCTGYDKYKSIEIEYSFSSGRQLENHPNPGKWYQGITRKCYLPKNKEGMLICEMLKLAFDRKLVFTFGTSRTTGQEGVITWNNIHHKTNIIPHGKFGYPDSTYFDRVKDELAIKGITEKDIAPDVYKQIIRDYH